MKRRSHSRNASSSRIAIKYLSPSLAVMGLVILYPLINAVRLSFLNYKLTQPKEVYFNFFQNYIFMLSDDVFWIALQNTVVFTLSTVIVSLLIGLIIALVIFELPWRYRSLRGLLLVPWVIPGIVIGYLFMYMFDVEIGIISFVLYKLRIIKEFLPWLMREDLSMIAIIITHAWNQTPFYLLMFSAGLTAIPEEAIEEAYLEGASWMQEFRLVFFPYLKQIFVISSLLMLIRNFNFFPIIFTMTGGGPAYATTTEVLYIYRLSFENFNIGYASAVGVFWVVILLIVSSLYIRVLKDRF